MDRRGFFKLAGAASAALMLTRFPILPRVAQPHPDLLAGLKVGPAPKIELGLLRSNGKELRAAGYCRQVVVPQIANGEATIEAYFPTVIRAWPEIKSVAVYRDGELMFTRHFGGGPIQLSSGHTLKAHVQLRVDTPGWSPAGDKLLQDAMFGQPLMELS